MTAKVVEGFRHNPRHREAKPVTNRYHSPAQLEFSFVMSLSAPMTRKRSGRPLSRYLRFLDFVRAAVRRDGLAPSYGMVCRELGLPERADVRRLVIYGEQRGDLCRGNGRRIGLVEGVAA